MRSHFKTFVFLTLIFTGFLSFVGWDRHLGSIVTRFVILLLIPFTLTQLPKLRMTPLLRIGMCLMLFHFPGIITAYAVHDQGMMDTFIPTFSAFIWLILPLMYVWRIEEEKLLRMCFVIGAFWALVPLIQQVTYPFYLFGSRVENEAGHVSMRNGIVRFSVAGTTWGLLMLFYSFQKYFETNRDAYLKWIVIGLVGVYMTCTRQIMAASVGCLIVGFFALRRKVNPYAMLGIIIVVMIICFNAASLFGGFIELTERDVNNEDYVRILAYRFYGYEYNGDNLLQILLGNGIPRLDHDSAYADEMINVAYDFGFFFVDVGYGGAYFLYGAFFILSIIAFYCYVYRQRRYIDLYLKMYVLYMLTTGIMLMHFGGGSSVSSELQTLMVFYLIERSIQANKRKLGVPSERERILRNSKFWERTGSFIGGAFKKE